MGETKFKKIKNSLLLVLLVFVSLSAVSASAITSISPTEGHSSINQQPLLSWSNSVIENFDTYALTISPHSDMSNPITNKILKNTFYQTQSPLPTGKWYWQVKANGTNSANETVEEISNIFSFEIITIPQYTVVPNLSRYDEEKRVDFIMDAPLGSEVSITISKTGFTLPFTSQSLVSQTFVSFLDPGTYTIEAEFVNNGLTTSYSGNFHLEQYIIPIHKVQFNISDQDDKALLGTQIHILGTNHDFNTTIKTNSEGLASIELEEGRYNININKEGYYNKDLTKKDIDKDKNFTYTLFEENYFASTTSIAPNVRASSGLTILPEVTLVLPTYRQEIKEELTAVFAVDNHAYASSCELLFKTKDQKGWSILSTLESINSTGNSLTGKVSEYGESQIKVRCHSKHSDTIKDSTTRTILVLMPPQHHDGVQEFLLELEQAKNTLSSSTDPLYKHLGLQEKISKTRQDLLALDEQYFQITGDGKLTEAEALSRTIEQKINSLKEELVVGFKIIQTNDVVQTSSVESMTELVEIYLEKEEEKGALFMMEEKEEERILRDILEAQSDYFIRSKSSVIELIKADGSKEFITGLTRTIQNFGEKKEYVIGEEVNNYLLQQSGTTTLISEENKELLSTSKANYFLNLNEGESYSLLFQGDVSELLTMKTALVIIPKINYTHYRTKGKSLESITGKAISAISGDGGVLSILLWALIGIALIGFVFSPLLINKKTGSGKKGRKSFSQSKKQNTLASVDTQDTPFPVLFSGDKKQKTKKQKSVYMFNKGKVSKKIQTLTDSVHDILDLIELGNHQEAFMHFPKIISLYETLPLPAQEELSFAVQLLTAELDAYDMQEHIQEANKHLDSLKPEHDTNQVAEHTTTMIQNYLRLDEHAKNRIKPHLESYQQKLEEKHKEFSRQN